MTAATFSAEVDTTLDREWPAFRATEIKRSTLSQLRKKVSDCIRIIRDPLTEEADRRQFQQDLEAYQAELTRRYARGQDVDCS